MHEADEIVINTGPIIALVAAQRERGKRKKGTGE